MLGKRRWGDIFKFTFVRNPYTRTYSAFCYLKKGGIGTKDPLYRELLAPYGNFESFLKDGGLNMAIEKNIIHFKPQNKFVLINNRVSMNFIGKYFDLMKINLENLM